MDRQAAQDLFLSRLRRRNLKDVDIDKEVPGLLKYALSYGFFTNPYTVQDLEEWRCLGTKLWELVLDDDKPARKWRKVWKVVHNELLLIQAEKRAAEEARAAHERNCEYTFSQDPAAPNPPAFSTVQVPAPSAPSLQPPSAPPEPSAPPIPPPPLNPFLDQEPVPGAESDLAEALAKERREAWAALAREGLATGDSDLLGAEQEMAGPAMTFPVIFTPNNQGGQTAQVSNLDWKMLAQLRATVGQYGVTSEPARQMLECMFNAQMLLPVDIKGITKLIYTPHQRLLFEARWREEAAQSAHLPRAQQDPLHGLTVDELLGQGQYARIEQQAALGPEKLREAIAVAKRAIDKIKSNAGVPLYMSIKQGRDEPLGSFVDKVLDSLSKVGVPDHSHDALLKQCILQNGNPTTRQLISSVPGDWQVQQLLEKAALLPSGFQAFLVDALQTIGQGLQQQAQTIGQGLQQQAEALQAHTASAHSQVMAAFAPLQAMTATSRPRVPTPGQAKCFLCGKLGHLRRDCAAPGIWCTKCQSNTHNTTACRKKSGPSGNWKASATSSRAGTQMAAAATPCDQPPPRASGWTWQPQ
ncbi:GAK8 protein, partial [Sylvietta virens]|nr:GAK8 protein [Sylvietta virens]